MEGVCLMLAIAQEIETLLVAFVEKGAGVEADVLASVVSLLPQEVKEQLPAEVCIPVHIDANGTLKRLGVGCCLP
jgi:hypothetical protein